MHTKILLRLLLGLYFLNVPLTTASAIEIHVPSSHPRVYLQEKNLAEIRTKTKLSEFSFSWQQIKESASSNEPDPWAIAFVYLIENNPADAARAIQLGLSDLKTTTDVRKPGNTMQAAACIYDWCYDQLTPTLREDYIAEFQRIAGLASPWYPAQADSMNAVCGHDMEGWLLTAQLPAGLAIYYDSPTMFDAANTVFQELVVPVFNFFAPAHMHHQGDSYAANRFCHEILATWLYHRIGYDNLISKEQRLLPYQFLYHRRPDKRQFKSGDTYDDRGRLAEKKIAALLAGSFSGDPYLLGYWLNMDPYWDVSRNAYPYIFDLLFRPLNTQTQTYPLSELPLTKYFAEPMGEMIARTGWDFGINQSPDAVAYMRIGGTLFGNHQCKDWGIFQIYYKGILALTTGLYTGNSYGDAHWEYYRHATISHNGLLIEDPVEPGIRVNGKSTLGGGQRWPDELDIHQDFNPLHPKDVTVLQTNEYTYGQVTAVGFGPDDEKPEYSFIAGDITNAYSSKVEKVTRSMVALNTGNAAWPMVMMTFDFITASDARYTKKWLVHSIGEPVIEGKSISIIDNRVHPELAGEKYNGKLVIQSLLPAQVNIEKIGGPGYEFWVNGENYTEPTSDWDSEIVEAGNWRIEISPAIKQPSDHLFHVMVVMDANTANAPEINQLETEKLVGATILDRTVLFSKLNRLMNKTEIFEIKGAGAYKVLLMGVAPGLWRVKPEHGPELEIRANLKQRCLYFEALPGLVELQPLSLEGVGVEMTNRPLQVESNESARLLQNYPNPFNPATQIHYNLHESLEVNLAILNICGQTIRTIIDAWQPAGNYAVEWNGRNSAGEIVSSGIYFVRLKTQNHVTLKKMSLIR